MFAARRLPAQRYLAGLLFASALLLKLLVPAGYMIGSDHGRLTIRLCSGTASVPMTMPGMHGDMSHHGKSPEQGKPEMPCAFSALSATALGAVDPIQLAALLAFVIIAGRAPAVLPVRVRQAYLRPPLRGPPVTY